MRQQLVVADDEPGFRTLVRKVANTQDWDVIECANGAEMLEAVPTLDQNSLLLIDIMMPEVDGIEAISRLADLSSGQPLYFVTGGLAVFGDMVEHLAKSKGLNLQGVLQKPLSLSDLSDILQEHASD